MSESIDGYRRDIDNCLAELTHKNKVLRDRDAERDRLTAEIARLTAERDELRAAARVVFSTWICLRDAGRSVPRGLEYGCESLGNAIAACDGTGGGR